MQIKDTIANDALKDETKKFGVRIIDDSSKEGNKNEVKQVSLKQLGHTITINVFAVSAKDDEQREICVLDVNINDKLQKVVDLLALDNISGLFVYGSNILNEEKLDQTFAKLFVKNGGKFGVMKGGVPMKEPTRYIRFANYS